MTKSWVLLATKVLLAVLVACTWPVPEAGYLPESYVPRFRIRSLTWGCQWYSGSCLAATYKHWSSTYA